jgi:hypothetical protein
LYLLKIDRQKDPCGKSSNRPFGRRFLKNDPNPRTPKHIINATNVVYAISDIYSSKSCEMKRGPEEAIITCYTPCTPTPVVIYILVTNARDASHDMNTRQLRHL